MTMILDTIAALRQQEDNGYTARNFLHQDDPAVSVCTGPLSVDSDCRSKMVAWCYQIADYCKFQRETVEICINYLDRFMVTSEGSQAKYDPQLYQLAAMTCLYLAVKIHEPQAMDLNSISKLSRDAYSPEDIKAMEESILFSLQWKLNPPTALSFARHFFDLVPRDALDERMRQAAYDITKYQTELAVNESELISVKPSFIAYCAIMNSLESLDVDDKILGQISHTLSRSIGTNKWDSETGDVQSWLYKAVVQQTTNDFALPQQPSGYSSCSKESCGSSTSDTGDSPRSISAVR